MKLKDTLNELKNVQEQRKKDSFAHEATKGELDSLKDKTAKSSAELESLRSRCNDSVYQVENSYFKQSNKKKLKKKVKK